MNRIRNSISTIFAIIIVFCIFTADSPPILAQNDYEFRVIDLEWSPDRAYLAVAYEFDTLEIRDGQSGDIILTYQHDLGIHNFGWSPDSQRLAYTSGGYNYAAYVSIFNISTQSIEATAEFYASEFGDVEWSTVGTQIAVMSAEELRDWGLQGLTLFEITPQGLEISSYFDIEFGSIDWRPNSPQIAATAYWTGYVVIMDVSVESFVKHIQNDQSFMLELAYSADGSKLAVLDDDRVLRIYDTETFALLTEIEVSVVGDIAWSPDGRHIAIGGGIGLTGILEIYDLETMDTILTLRTASLSELAWSPDGSQIAYGGIDSFEIIPTPALDD